MSQGTVNLRRTPFVLFGRWSLHDPGESGFSIRGGLSVEVLRARGHEFTRNDVVTVPAFGFFAAGRGEWRAGQRVGLFVEATLTLVPVHDSFQIDTLDTSPKEVAVAPQVVAGGLAGLSLHFF